MNRVMNTKTPQPQAEKTAEQNSQPSQQTVAFTQMKDGTKEDYSFLDKLERSYLKSLPDRLMATMALLEDSLGGYQVSRLGHSLQTATRAQNDGADTQMIAAALLHDIGDLLAPMNHAEFAAAILQPYVREELSWIVAKHGIFQKYYYAHHLGGDREEREKFKTHRWYPSCAEFCERWDQASFDPKYKTLPLAHFEPMVREVFSRPLRGL